MDNILQEYQTSSIESCKIWVHYEPYTGLKLTQRTDHHESILEQVERHRKEEEGVACRSGTACQMITLS